MAELNPPRMQPSRQRSASPTLENWLNRRDERKANARPGASHRASSLPSRERERAADEEDYLPRSLQPLNIEPRILCAKSYTVIDRQICASSFKHLVT